MEKRVPFTSRIDRYLDALVGAMSKMDPMSFWPIGMEEIAAYFTDLEAADVSQKIGLLKERGLSQQETAKLFLTPSFLREVLPDLIVGSKYTKLSKEERTRLVESLLGLLEEMHSGDIFCSNDKNLMLSKNEVSELVESTPWIKDVEPKKSQSIHRLSTSLLALMWTLYFYPWPNLGFEIHGPYDVSDLVARGYSLLVRDFFNLRPMRLWPRLEDLRISQARLLTLYQDVDIKIDIFDHMTHTDDLASSTRAFAVYFNGDVLENLTELDDLNQQLLLKCSAIGETVEGMNREEKVMKFISIRYYGLRKLREHLGEDWQPPAEIKERLDSWGPIQIPEGEPGPSISELRRMFDPREDYKPRR